MNDCIFCKIIKGEIPSKKIYEDEMIFGFLDINPHGDGHLLLILHNNGDTPAVVFPFHGKKQEQDSSVKMVSRSERSWSERNRYLEESYMDAFEGDSDAYWNID